MIERSRGSNARCQESSSTNTQVQLLQFLSCPNQVGWHQKANGTAQTTACWALVRLEIQWISPWRFQHVKRCRNIEKFFAINDYQPRLSMPFLPGTFHIEIVVFWCFMYWFRDKFWKRKNQSYLKLCQTMSKDLVENWYFLLGLHQPNSDNQSRDALVLRSDGSH